MTTTNDPTVLAAVARTVKGHTIAWGGDVYFDFDDPAACPVMLEDYAYALAFTVRWRGQCRNYLNGSRVFYGTAEHCYRGARQLLADGYSRDEALAFLMHESDEVPLPDMPGPVKPKLGPAYKELAKSCGDALDRRFRVPTADPALIKRYDVRMLLTERRDLMRIPLAEIWTNGGNGGATSTEGFEAFADRIVPMAHPEKAARAFIALYRELEGFEPE